MRHVCIALFALLAYTTAMNYEPVRGHHIEPQHGYTRGDIAGLNRLIDRVMRPKAVRHHEAWTVALSRSALQSLGWEVAEE